MDRCLVRVFSYKKLPVAIGFGEFDCFAGVESANATQVVDDDDDVLAQ